jgi:hypothetical protein
MNAMVQNMRNNRYLEVFFALTLMSCGLIGCGQQSPSTPDAAGHADHHVHEHQTPSFRGAVKEITFLHARVLKYLKSGDSHKLEHELDHVVEILERLPEIAADSDLRKADWELANQRSHVLLSKYRQLEQSVKAASPSASGSLEGAESLIADLSKLIPASNKRQ